MSNQFNCPRCGHNLKVITQRSQISQMTELDTIPGMLDNPLDTMNPTIVEDVIVPFLRSSVIGSFAGILTALTSSRMDVAAGVAITVTAAAWLFWENPRTPTTIESTIIETPQEQTEKIRLVPFRPRHTAKPKFTTSDGRTIDQKKLGDMIIARELGFEWATKRGWTRTEWETARDILADNGIATPRSKGAAGKLLMSSREARELIGLSPTR